MCLSRGLMGPKEPNGRCEPPPRSCWGPEEPSQVKGEVMGAALLDSEPWRKSQAWLPGRGQ